MIGEPLIGAQVMVDGRYTASVPNALEVPIGPHRVEVTHRDGTTLPAKRVEVTPFHSRQRPLRVTW